MPNGKMGDYRLGLDTAGAMQRYKGMGGVNLQEGYPAPITTNVRPRPVPGPQTPTVPINYDREKVRQQWEMDRGDNKSYFVLLDGWEVLTGQGKAWLNDMQEKHNNIVDYGELMFSEDIPGYVDFRPMYMREYKDPQGNIVREPKNQWTPKQREYFLKKLKKEIP